MFVNAAKVIGGIIMNACFGACRVDWLIAVGANSALAENDVPDEAQSVDSMRLRYAERLT